MHINIWHDVLPASEIAALNAEIDQIAWTKTFDRAGSYMLEYNNLQQAPQLQKLYHRCSSAEFLTLLQNELHITGILPDPHLIGAGYSQIKDHGDLKPHIDFNWNDTIKLHRVATYIIYLTTPHSGGEIEFVGMDKIAVKQNMAVLFSHSETVKHMVHPVQGIRNAVRFFYYASLLSPPVHCHKSLYD